MKTSKVIQRFSAALTLQAVADTTILAKDSEVNGFLEMISTVEANGATGQTDRNLDTVSDVVLSHKTRTFDIKIQTPPEWNAKSAKRYRTLVRKEALDEIDATELVELETLQRVKLRSENSVTSDELLFRYRREKMDKQMIEILSKYVHFEPDPAHQTNSATS